MPPDKLHPISVKVPESLNEEVDLAAARRMLKKSDWIRYAIREQLRVEAADHVREEEAAYKSFEKGWTELIQKINSRIETLPPEVRSDIQTILLSSLAEYAQIPLADIHPHT